MIKFRRMLGVVGVSRKENSFTIKWSYFFDTVLVIILLWLPIQWYMQRSGQIALQAVSVIDWIIWIAFVSETLTLTLLVKEKKRYLRENWLNVFVIIIAFPMFFISGSSYFAFLRYFRLMIILRLASVQVHFVYRILRINRFGTTLLAFLIVTLLSGIIASYIDPSIGPPWEGMWWAFQTITTVGYGDVVPHTIAGKIFACVLMMLGVGLLSIVAANFSAFLIGGSHQAKAAREVKDTLQTLSERFEDLEKANRKLIEEIKKQS